MKLLTPLFIVASRAKAMPIILSCPVRMPFGAELFTGIQGGWALASKVILFGCNYFKMLRSHTERYAAQVIKLHPFWDRSVNKLPRKAMSENMPARRARQAEHAIPGPVSRGSPKPARLGLVDLRPKAIFGRLGTRESLTCSPKALVMAFAIKAYSGCWLGAIVNRTHGTQYTMSHCRTTTA